MKRGLPGGNLRVVTIGITPRRPVAILYAGLDLSRHRVDVHLMNEAGEPVLVTVAPPDADGLRGLARQAAGFGQPVAAAIESMNGARFVHDQLELAGWEVAIADAQKAKGLAPLACKTDRIDAWVLAELSRRELVPAIWLPTPEVRAERERARFRLHLVRHRTALKNQAHATVLAFGRPCPTADLFGAGGRQLLERLGLPEPWAGTTAAAVVLIDDLEAQIDTCEGGAASAGRRPRLRAPAHDGPRHRLGPGLHHRRRAGRHHPVRVTQEAVRLHRVVPQGLPVRQP
jgi:transposase